MAHYLKRPVIVEAVQWHGPGDHPAVTPAGAAGGDLVCARCGAPALVHGWITTPGTGRVSVCPGDWIIQGLPGAYETCPPALFRLMYEPWTDGA